MLVSDYVARFLKLQGVDLFFTITGAGAVRMIHSFNKQGINYVCPHHEQAAVMASIARMRLTGKPAVCLFTGGPGAINCLTGIADAFLDSLPIIVLAGQESSHNLINDKNLRGLGVQGLRMTEITKTITKYSKTIMTADEAPMIIYEAFREANSGRKGPVFVDIPMDVQWQEIPKRIEKKYLRKVEFIPNKVSVTERKDLGRKLDHLFSLILKSERPLIWAGHGIRLSNAENVFSQVVKLLNIPVLTSWQAADLISESDPLYVGRAGTYGQRFANLALQNCDLLICLGTRLAIPQRGYKDHEFARSAKKIIVEIDKNEINKIKFKFDIAFNNDVKLFLESINSKLRNLNFKSSAGYKNWKTKIKHWKNLYPMAIPLSISSKPSKINSYNFIEILSSRLKSKHVVVTDMGTSLTCTHATIKIKKGQRLITSTGLGEMGYGLPAAIGCSLSKKDADNIILIAGEGSLMMNLQELQTLDHLKIPLKIILLNNNSYLTIEHTHKALYKIKNAEATRENSGVSFPNFKKICDAFNIKYQEARTYVNIENKLDDFINHKGPILLNVIMEDDQELIPKSAIKVKDNGEIFSPPLEDLYPFLERDELEREMIIPLIDED